MRITPTQDQMGYLTSIGVDRTTISQRHCPTAAGGQDMPSASPTRNASVYWWAGAVIIVLLILLAGGLAHGQTIESMSSAASAQNYVTTDGDEGPHATAIVLEDHARNPDGAHWGKAEAMMQAVPVLQRLLGVFTSRHALEQQISSVEHRLVAEVAQAKQITEDGIAELRAAQQASSDDAFEAASHLNRRIDAISQAFETRSQDTAQFIERGEEARRDLRADFQGLETRLHAQNHRATHLITGGAVGLAMILMLIAVWRVQVKDDMRRITETVMTHSVNLADENSAPTENDSKSTPSTGQKLNATQCYEPTRAKRASIPEPHEAMRALMKVAKRLPHISNPPVVPTESWTLGMATAKGNVRSENQDYGMCFRVAGHDVLVVADGCGGVKHGRQAAHLAAMSATASVARAYGIRQRWHVPHVEDVAVRALKSAAHTLAVAGDKLNITDVRGGLRTTLIVVVGNSRDIGFAYIGDGGGCVVKSTGEIRRFLDPQKANGFAMNVLAASLGPQTEGDPVSGAMRRDPGDLVVVGSDGIFDRVDANFPREVMRGCIQHQGNLQGAADQIVAELASFRDSAGYVCDDNLSLGLMGDGAAPKLSPGFWASTQPNGVTSSTAEPTGTVIKEMV